MPIKIFFCYAHEDEALLKQLKIHLTPLQREKLIEIWYDRDINAGVEWEKDINEHLNAADIILLLISPDFMASEYCYSVEMQRALERNERGEVKVIPIILRPGYWQIAGLDKLQALPRDAIPVINPIWHSLDQAFLDIAEGISQVIRSWKSKDVEVTDDDAPHQKIKAIALESDSSLHSLPSLETNSQEETNFPVVGQKTRTDKLSLLNDLDALYREGVVAQSQDDLELAISFWQKILEKDQNFRGGKLASQLQKLQQRLPAYRVGKLREQAQRERKAKLYEQEIRTWEALLELKPEDNAARGRLATLYLQQAEKARKEGAWNEEIYALEKCLNSVGGAFTPERYKKLRKRLTIAQQNQEGAWMYENAIKLVEEGYKDAAKTTLFELWQNAPFYGDPAKLMKKVGILIKVPLGGWRGTIYMINIICGLVSISIIVLSYILVNIWNIGLFQYLLIISLVVFFIDIILLGVLYDIWQSGDKI